MAGALGSRSILAARPTIGATAHVVANRNLPATGRITRSTQNEDGKCVTQFWIHRNKIRRVETNVRVSSIDLVPFCPNRIRAFFRSCVCNQNSGLER